MPRPWRIAHLDTERSWRGGERQLLLLAAGLANRGHVNFVACRPESALAAQAAAEGFTVVPLRARGEWDVWAARKLREWLDDQQVQVVHAHTAHTTALAALAVRNTSVRLIITRRVDFPIQGGPFSRWKYGQADRVIAVSDAVRRVLVAGGVREGRIVVVPDGLPLPVPPGSLPPQRTDGSSLRALLAVPLETPLVGIVAALAPHKDHDTFLRAARQVSDQHRAAHFVVLGEGALRPNLEAQTQQLGLARGVHFLGFRSDALTLMNEFDVVVLSSKEEGLGSVLLEAMAMGKAIAATTAGGIPEVIVHERTGLLVPPRHPAALAEAMLRLLRDPSLRQRLGAAARTAVQRFSAARMIGATEQVYAEALSGSSPMIPPTIQPPVSGALRSGSVSAVVMTKNEAHNIEDCLRRLTWADEVVVVDDFSTDRTVELARGFTERVIQRRWDGFGPQKQFAIAQAQGEWVLLVDADERVSPALAAEIQRAIANHPREQGFRIPFRLIFLGRRLRFGGLRREQHLRLFRKGAAQVIPTRVHEQLVVTQPVGRLSSLIEHESYRDLREYRAKREWYTTLAAQDLFTQGVRTRWWHGTHAGWEFVRRCVLYAAWLDGWRGLLYAGLSASYVWQKYAKLKQLCREHLAPSTEAPSPVPGAGTPPFPGPPPYRHPSGGAHRAPPYPTAIRETPLSSPPSGGED